MKVQLFILFVIYICIESLFELFGYADSKIWAVLYYINQSALIIGLIWLLKDFMNTVLLSIIIALNIFKIAYNCLCLFCPNIAGNINRWHFIGAVIISSLLITLIIKRNDK